MMTIDETQLRAVITGAKTEVSAAELAVELLAARQKISELERQLATPIRLPFSSASPVCEIEAGYAAGVSDCRQAIREAGFPIEGED
ncbi:hypothetical protein FYL58_22470 [Klebsiella aerogenes]|nr:hypothetical protein [Klebsiella aerogenes]EIW9500299.1 hypothetical protein [Klebsiella aerogenes]OWP38620.1 hypothetical protein CEG88_23290 [Klebsiella aerogenes]